MAINLVQPFLDATSISIDHPTATHRLVLIDAGIDSPEILAAGVLPDTALEMIECDRDGIAQITEALHRHPGTTSLHLVSHGAPGKVYVGNTELSLETLDRYANQLMSWSEWLTPDAELLIYGCEVAKGEEGRVFIARLSELTGASIAASAIKTGAAALEGDWNLEIKSGNSTAAIAFQQSVIEAYPVTLALAGALDQTFGAGGKVTTDFYGFIDEGRSVVVQPDGKIIVAGFAYDSSGSNADFALSRYNNDGSLDTSFGFNGRITTDFNGSNDLGHDVILQSDGKIVVVGPGSNSTNFAVSRYNSDGSLDTSFGSGGKVTTDFASFSYNLSANSVALQSDGKIVVAGSGGGFSAFVVSRYNGDGSLDTSFGTTGNIFGTPGKVITNFAGGSDRGYGVTLQSDGKIIVVGSSSTSSFGPNTGQKLPRFGLSRYNTDGSLDISFGSEGKVRTAFGLLSGAFSVVEQSDGKIVVAGETSEADLNKDFALCRYNSDGSLDVSFGLNGRVATDFNGSSDTGYGITLQSDGKIVVAGSSNGKDFALSRYNSDGSLDIGFGVNGKVTTDFNGLNDLGYSVALQPDGNIVVAGKSNSDFAIARYLAEPTKTISKSDFNGDGKTDVVARNRVTGENTIILMDDTTVSQFVVAAPVADLNWSIDGTGDFNNDSKTDVVLRNKATGENAIALMNGTVLNQVVFTDILPNLNWVIGGVGDFNKDGNLDILYRNKATGENSIALMNRTNLTQTVSVGILPDLNWEIGGVGDFNKDGNDDILYRNKATGENTIALMDGTTLGQTVSTPILSNLNWSIGSVGDFNRDGNVDILFRNQVTGENTFALMNGTNLSQLVPTLTVADTNWQIGA
jgi:uncharacterized delta-60 repeat protein